MGPWWRWCTFLTLCDPLSSLNSTNIVAHGSSRMCVLNISAAVVFLFPCGLFSQCFGWIMREREVLPKRPTLWCASEFSSFLLLINIYINQCMKSCIGMGQDIIRILMILNSISQPWTSKWSQIFPGIISSQFLFPSFGTEYFYWRCTLPELGTHLTGCIN